MHGEVCVGTSSPLLMYCRGGHDGTLGLSARDYLKRTHASFIMEKIGARPKLRITDMPVNKCHSLTLRQRRTTVTVKSSGTLSVFQILCTSVMLCYEMVHCVLLPFIYTSPQLLKNHRIKGILLGVMNTNIFPFTSINKFKTILTI